MVGDEHNLVNDGTTSAFRKLTFVRAVDKNVKRKKQIDVRKMELMYVPTVSYRIVIHLSKSDNRKLKQNLSIILWTKR